MTSPPEIVTGAEPRFRARTNVNKPSLSVQSVTSRRGAAVLFGSGVLGGGVLGGGVRAGGGVLGRVGTLVGGAARATIAAFGGADARGGVRAATGERATGAPAAPQHARLIVAAASVASELLVTGIRATGWLPD
jgi:hypothetical protein